MFVAAVALSSCAKENVESSLNKNSGKNLVFECAKPNFSDEAKTAWTGKTIQWSKGDKIVMAYTCDNVWQNADGSATADEASGSKTAKLYSSTQLSADAETAQFKIPTSFKATTEGTYQFYGLYPSTCTSTNFTYAPSANLTVPTYQTPAADSFDSSADILIGKAVQTYTSLPSDAISVKWDRLVAHAQLTFKAINGFADGETIKTIKLTANSDADMVGFHYLDMTTSVITKPLSNTTANILTIGGDNLVPTLADGAYNVTAWAAFLPVTITSLGVIIETDKAIYSRDLTGVSFSFLKNARNALTINMSGATREEKAAATQIVEDGVYAIAYSTYMMTVGTSSDAYRGSETLSTQKDASGALMVTSDAAWQFTYDATADTYSIMSMDGLDSPYVKGIASNSDLTLVGEGDKSNFTIAKQQDGTLKIGLTSGSNTRYIGYNTQSPRFAMYKGSTSQPVSLTLYPAVIKSVISASDISNVEAVGVKDATVAITLMGVTSSVTATPDGTVVTAASVSGTTLTYTVSENTTSAAREGSITLSADGVADCVIKVSQLAVGQTNPVSYSLTFPDDNKENNKLSSYTSSWTAKIGDNAWSIVNFNNNNWNDWTSIKAGSKKADSAAKITTDWAIKEAISKLTVEFGSVTTTYVNSIKWEISSQEDFSTIDETITLDLTKVDSKIVESSVTTPSTLRYYRLTVECKKGKNGIVEVKSVTYSDR